MKNGHWRVRWLDADGKRRPATFTRKAEAQAFLTLKQAQVLRIKAGTEATSPKPHTFGEVCDDWLANVTVEKRSPKDDESMIRAHLRPAFGRLQLTQVTVQRSSACRR